MNIKRYQYREDKYDYQQIKSFVIDNIQYKLFYLVKIKAINNPSKIELYKKLWYNSKSPNITFQDNTDNSIIYYGVEKRDFDSLDTSLFEIMTYPSATFLINCQKTIDDSSCMKLINSVKQVDKFNYGNPILLENSQIIRACDMTEREALQGFGFVEFIC